ncbi:MAG: hypothetical protein HQL71_13260 [Magnetococcales bacterium]|nr:hypothetical protein [Magnetococcales bacterium]
MGTIIRTLLLTALFYLLARVVQYFLSRFLTSSPKVEEGDGPILVQCVKCGTWTPKETVFKRGEHIYCSENCAAG